MVAIINCSSSLRNALHYNENKLKQQAAKLIHSTNYGKDTELLGFTDKIGRLEKLAKLNERTKLNSIHISLNFDPLENIPVEKLQEIGDAYMQKIGFGEQPYLVYQHYDAGHPHIHIVTTNIQKDGSRIKLHNLGRNQSEKARKEIEREFGLVQAENRQRLDYQLKPLNVQKVHYGKAETKRSITNVLDHVLPVYKYASLAELNAVLQQYNIIADRGSENSRIYKSGGLVYRILNSNGEKVGVPIKASLIHSQPTLKNIEANFAQNEADRERYKQRVRNAIDVFMLTCSNRPLGELSKALQKENIRMMLRQNDKGIIYGITYVDHKTKCVFNGSHLGKQYSANGLQQRCNGERPTLQKQQSLLQRPQIQKEDIQPVHTGLSHTLEDLIKAEGNKYANEPPEQQKFKRKRKRKQQQLNN